MGISLITTEATYTDMAANEHIYIKTSRTMTHWLIMTGIMQGPMLNRPKEL